MSIDRSAWPDLRPRRGGRKSANTKNINSKTRKRKQERLIERDGNQCHWCGIPFGAGIRATLDHLRPRRLGGTEALINLVLACKPCNQSRPCDPSLFPPLPANDQI